MEIRFQNSPKETRGMTTEDLRASYLCGNIIKPGEISYIYSHFDRMIIGGVNPLKESLALTNHIELKAEFFLERREIGIINVGGAGIVSVNNENYTLGKLECIYVGKGAQDVHFSSADATDPAIFFLLSVPAHQTFPTTKYTREQAAPVNLGTAGTSNERTIYKYIHADGIQSCQLVMGLTVLKEGSVWNSVPPHTHTRRMEVYFYFDVPEEQRIFHMMGEPTETRHLVMKNNEAVIAPPWSVHFGCGTSNYSFIWGMAGENKQFTDMDPQPVSVLR